MQSKDKFFDFAEVNLLTEDVFETSVLSGDLYGEMERICVQKAEFTEAIRIRTTVRPPSISDLKLLVPVDGIFKPGDTLLITFYVRGIESSDESGTVNAQFAFVKGEPPFAGTGVYSFNVPVRNEDQKDEAWQKFQVPFIVNKNHDSKSANLEFAVGYRPQIMDISGFELTNYGSEVSIADLPFTKLTYPGREENAPWRVDAQDRIEKIRKSDLKFNVTDQQGHPIEGAKIQCRMSRHAFRFGTAIDSNFLLGASRDCSIYKQKVKELFNSAVMHNEMKWPNWENENREKGVKSVEWLIQNGLEVRGHTLVWGGWKFLPHDLKTLKDIPDALWERVKEHIVEEASYYKGKLFDWDVINEPIPQHALWDILGNDKMCECFELAHQSDTEAKLYLNEYHIEGSNTSKIASFITLVEELIKRNTPIDGIGLQAHFGMNAPGPEIFIENLDRFSRLTEELAITEFDISTPDEEMQADYLRDTLIASFSHPSVKSFIIWGFWDGTHFRDNAPVFRKDWSMKPAGMVWRDLIYKDWWTDEVGHTDGEGNYTTRGFLGDYEVCVSYNGKIEKRKCSLPSNGSSISFSI